MVKYLIEGILNPSLFSYFCFLKDITYEDYYLRTYTSLFLYNGFSSSDYRCRIGSTRREPQTAKNNLVKVNLAPLIWSTGSLTYEHKISKRLTAGGTLNYRPSSKVPFKSSFEDIITDEDNSSFDINALEYSNFSFAPEIKLYLGKKGAFHGFYVAAFAKWENTKVDYLYQFEELTLIQKDINLPLEGTAKAFTGGVYFGAQWHLGKNIYLDWQIIGGNFGSAKLDITAVKDLTQEEQDELRKFAEDLKDSFEDIDYEINGRGVKLKGKMSWAGLRTGISVAYRF